MAKKKQSFLIVWARIFIFLVFLYGIFFPLLIGIVEPISYWMHGKISKIKKFLKTPKKNIRNFLAHRQIKKVDKKVVDKLNDLFETN